MKLDANDKLQLSSDPKAGVEYRLESLSIDAVTGETTTTVEGMARFYLPATDDHKTKTVIGDNDLAIYAGDSYDIALDASEEGFAAYVYIRDASAPTSYEFEFGLPSGFKLSEDGEGGIEVLNVEGDVIGTVAPPWAVDANGDSAPTAYKLRDNVLVQTVEHVGAVYPVVSDPEVRWSWTSVTRHFYIGDEEEYSDLGDGLSEVEDFVEDYKREVCGTISTAISLTSFIKAIKSSPTSIPSAILSGLDRTINIACNMYIKPSANAMQDAVDEIREDVLSDPLPDRCEVQLQ